MKWIPKPGDHISVRMPNGGYYHTIAERDIGGAPCYDISDPRWNVEHDLSHWRYNLWASVKARLERKRNEAETK